jgi:periplasmic protein TonB
MPHSQQAVLLLTCLAFATSGLTVGKAQEPSSPPPSPQAQAQPEVPKRMRVSAGITSGLLKTKVQPLYPEKARANGIQGIVDLDAEISKDGDVTHLSVISGDSLLAQAAMDAVKQWKYKPFLRNGQAMDVETTVRVAFTLSPK